MICVSLGYDLAFGYRRVSASFLKTLLKMSIPDKWNVIFLLIFFKGFFISCNYHVKSYCFSDRSKVNLVPLTLLYGGPLALLIPIMCLFFNLSYLTGGQGRKIFDCKAINNELALSCLYTNLLSKFLWLHCKLFLLNKEKCRPCLNPLGLLK